MVQVFGCATFWCCNQRISGFYDRRLDARETKTTLPKWICTRPGILLPEALGLGNWLKAQEWVALPGGQATYLGNPVPWGALPTILAIEFVPITFVKRQRSMEKDPKKKKYPSGAFDPLLTFWMYSIRKIWLIKWNWRGI